MADNSGPSGRRQHPLFDALRKGLAAQIPAMPFFASAALPENPNQVFLDEAEPDGLKRLYRAPSAAEADLLRQVLEEAGFHPEHVPSTLMGAFGIAGNPCIYVPSGEYDEALGFLKEYFNAPPEPDSTPANNP